MSLLRAPAMVFGGLMRTALTNERLFLMGLTSLALSLASGWTTFEGMTNFTRSPVLCFLITFGVQGIMLVSAWMIGETLVPVKNKNDDKEQKNRLVHAIMGPLSFFKVWMIWVVFFFAMAISVFFSFDSLFSSIFSNEERQRAGEIRAQNQVSGVLTDLKKRVEQRKFEAIDNLVSSAGWKNYNDRLDQMGKIARSAPELVEQQLLNKLRGEQAEIARHQETLAQANGQKAGFKSQQLKIEQSITRLQADRPGLSAEVDQLRQQLREKQRQLDIKLAEAQKESRGIGATGREGEGPKFRAIKKEERRIKAERDVINTQKDLASTRLETLDGKVAKLTQELELINGEVAKIEGKASVAKQFIEAQTKRQSANIVEDLSATASIDSLDAARDRFQQEPNQSTFLNIQKNCTNLHNALTEVPKIASQIRAISCEPGAATATVAARIFTLQDAQKSQENKCSIGKGRRSTKIDSLLKLGQRCIQQSGLPEKDANSFRNILSRIDLNRDDKAKNFVVTLNAFADGNWLAYLALGLAIAIDSLVFIAGLIGAKTASYENTGSPADVMKYGLGMSTEIYGHEPEDIRTKKIFFRSISGPSPEKGYLAVIDLKNLMTEEKQYVTKVLTIAGDNIKLDSVNPSAYHIEETFYQNLARQVYLWDQFNKPAVKKPKPIARKNTPENKLQNIQKGFDLNQFGQAPKGAIINKGEVRTAFKKNGPEKKSLGLNLKSMNKTTDEIDSQETEEAVPSVPLVTRSEEKTSIWQAAQMLKEKLYGANENSESQSSDEDAKETETASNEAQDTASTTQSESVNENLKEIIADTTNDNSEKDGTDKG